MITDRSHKLLELYSAYQDRILPFGGGLLDQPGPYIEAMNLIKVYHSEATNGGKNERS